MPEALTRIEFTGEVSGPGAEIVVVNDDQAEIEDTPTESPESGSTLVVRTRAIADIAVLGYVVAGHKESGFTGTWTSRLKPDSPPIPVRLIGSVGSGELRVIPETDDPAHLIATDTIGANRYYLKRRTA